MASSNLTDDYPDVKPEIIYMVVRHEYTSEKDDIPRTTIRAARKTRKDAWNVIQSYVDAVFSAIHKMKSPIIDKCKISNDGFMIFLKDGSIIFNEIEVMMLK